MLDTISHQASKLVKLTNKIRHVNIDSRTKVLTITSGKGGVGKSTITANMAYLLSKKGYKVAVLDADIGLANLQVLFNIKPQNSFFDYIDGKKSLNEVILQTSYDNVFLIAGKSGFEYVNKNNSFVFSNLVKDIISLNKFDILLVDTGAGLNDYVKEFLDISHSVLALTTTDPSALTDVYSLMKMLSLDRNKLLLCFNHTKNYKIGETITKSLINLARKNRLNENFMVEYLGNVSTSVNVTTTARLRKLFSKEFSQDVSTKELQLVIDVILSNL